MGLDSPDFQAYRGAAAPRFASPAELECAKVLDYYGIPWLYEPRTFVLEEEADGFGEPGKVGAELPPGQAELSAMALPDRGGARVIHRFDTSDADDLAGR